MSMILPPTLGSQLFLWEDGKYRFIEEPVTPPPEEFTVYSDADYPPVPTVDRPKSVQRTVAGIGAVNSGASDSNDGILVADGGTGPWATIDHALQQVCNPANGITVLNIDGTVSIDVSSWTKYYGAGTGTANDFFWVRSLPGQKGTLHFNADLRIDGPDYWLWHNLNFTGEYGLRFGQDSLTSHQQLRNCTGTMTGPGHDNTAFAVWLNSNSTYAGAFNCDFNGPGVDGIHLNTAGLLAFKVTSLRWENNKMTNFPRPLYFKHANEALAYVYIRNNYVTGEGSPFFALDGSFGGVTEVTNNIFDCDGIEISNGGGGAQVKQVLFAHNTCNGILHIRKDQTVNPLECVIKDNIFLQDVHMLRYIEAGVNTNYSNYNCYKTVLWYDYVSYSLSSWQSSSVPAGQDVNSVTGTPVFVGGATPSTAADWAIASGVGIGVASDGSNMGADVSKVGIKKGLSYGLLFEDGIEPVTSDLFPLATGRRIWYVDLDAPVDGDGSENNPLNHFTDLVGYWDGTNYTQGTLGFVGGDQIWVTGTGTPAKHVNGTTNMNIHLRRAAQFGTSEEPTVIRSWKGKPRAVFDGQFISDIGIFATLTSAANAGIVILNIEGKGCLQPSIYMDDYLTYVRVVSCYTHHNYALNGGPLESYGGIRVRNSRDGQDIAVYNNKTERNNTSNGVDTQASNNIGGISLLCQNNGTNNSVVKFYQNDCQNENYAIRHKHSGNCDFESYGNYIVNSNVAHYIRNAADNNLHDNVIMDCPVEVELVSENQSARRSLTYTDNQLTNVDKIITTAAQAETLGNDVTWSGNTYTNSTYTGPVIVMGQYASSASSLADVTGSGNVITKNGTDFAMENGAAVNLASYASTTGDTTTTQVTP